jgi:hypothetical protein
LGAPSLETSKFSLYFSGSCIPINPMLSYIFPPEYLVVFNRFQCEKYFVYILQQLLSTRTTHVGNPTWINSISPELCPPLTCERACSGNEIEVDHIIISKRDVLNIAWKCDTFCRFYVYIKSRLSGKLYGSYFGRQGGISFSTNQRFCLHFCSKPIRMSKIRHHMKFGITLGHFRALLQAGFLPWNWYM